MKKPWLILVGVLNVFAIFAAFAELLTTFAILDPDRLQYNLQDPNSIKAAIFHAEASGIELMRGASIIGSGMLAAMMIANFVLLCFISFKFLAYKRKPNLRAVS